MPDSNSEVVLLNIVQVQDTVKRIARDIDTQLTDKTNILVLGIMKGALFFTSDLLKALPFDCDYNLIIASSYIGTKSTTMVSVDLKGIDVKGKRIILVDEICDTGYTLRAVSDKLRAKGVTEIFTCVLLDKPSRREIDIHLDFVGQVIDNHYVIGYGLDDGGNKRCLPYIYYKQSNNKEAHEDAAGMNLDTKFFSHNGIDPNALYDNSAEYKKCLTDAN